MSPIAAALDAGIHPERLQVAAHEIGHGLIWHTAGFPIRHMKITPGWFVPVAGGECLRGKTRLDADNAHVFLIGLIAGAAAEYRVLTEHLGWSAGRARAAAWAHSGHDRREFRRLARAHRSRLTVNAAWGRAEAVLARHRGQLDRLTARLAHTGHLPGAAL